MRTRDQIALVVGELERLDRVGAGGKIVVLLKPLCVFADEFHLQYRVLAFACLCAKWRCANRERRRLFALALIGERAALILHARANLGAAFSRVSAASELQKIGGLQRRARFERRAWRARFERRARRAVVEVAAAANDNYNRLLAILIECVRSIDRRRRRHRVFGPDDHQSWMRQFPALVRLLRQRAAAHRRRLSPLALDASTTSVVNRRKIVAAGRPQARAQFGAALNHR